MPGPWSVTRTDDDVRWRRPRSSRSTRAARRAVGERVGDDVAQGPGEVTRIRPGDDRRPAPRATSRTSRLAPDAVEGRARSRRSSPRCRPPPVAPGAGAASARARSSMSATTPPSAAAADRAASSPARSVGTTPSIIAWSCDSRTVAGVARSWAMSLAARRRSISERSRRSAIAVERLGQLGSIRGRRRRSPGRPIRPPPAAGPRRRRRAAAGSAGRRSTPRRARSRAR